MNSFDEIRNLYLKSHEEHGDTPAALFTPKDRHEQRFRPILEVLQSRNAKSLLDYGCGLGQLRAYLAEMNVRIQYTGWDITPSFIMSCQSRFGTASRFEIVDPEAQLSEHFDIVVCSGVFNLSTSDDSNESLEYVLNRINQLLTITDQVFICDFLSPFVDFKQDRAQHIQIEKIAHWLIRCGYRRFVFRHDVLPYEYTVVVYKNDLVDKVKNVYLKDNS